MDPPVQVRPAQPTSPDTKLAGVRHVERFVAQPLGERVGVLLIAPSSPSRRSLRPLSTDGVGYPQAGCWARCRRRVTKGGKSTVCRSDPG